MNTKTKERISKILNAYFNDSLPPKLEEEIRDWFKDKGHEDEKYDALEQHWNRLITENRHPGKELLKSYGEMSELLGFPQKEPTRTKLFSLRRTAIAKIAAVLILVIVTGVTAWFMYQPGHIQIDEELFTSIVVDSTENYPTLQYLADGSELSINPGSKIIHAKDFTTERTVNLEGEAFFKVIKNQEKPFVVNTAYFTVTVLGTEFIVSSWPGSESSTVNLYEGSVKVETADSTYIMQPGTRFEYSHLTAEAQITRIPVDDVISRGYKPSLQMDNAPLGDIIKSIEANYDITFQLPTGISLGGSNTAIFENGLPLTEVLKLLKYITPGYDYRIEEHKVIMIKIK